MANIQHNDSDELDSDHTLNSSDEEFFLAVSRNEALYLDDCLTLMVEREVNVDHGKTMLSTLRNVAPVAQLPVPIELIDKIAWAVLYTTEDGSSPATEATLSLDASELYMLREVCQSYVRIGNEPVGFNLKRKIYYSLFEEEFKREKTIDRLIEEALPSSDNNDTPIVISDKTVKESPTRRSKR